jgi:hypothetical protein
MNPLPSALKRVSTIERFAFGGVGYAGVISKSEMDFKFILSQPQTTALPGDTVKLSSVNLSS